MTKSFITGCGFALCAVLCFTACNDDDAPVPVDTDFPLVVTARGYDYNETGEGTGYTKGETIGVAMMQGGTNSVVAPYANLRYYANSSSSQDYFLPGNNDSIPYFPATGDARDVSAYYPRTAVLADSLINLHLLENYDYVDELLWARANGLNKDNRKTDFELRPPLTQLAFTFTTGYGVAQADLTGLTVTLRGLPVSGLFNVLDGTMSYREIVTGDITMTARATTKTRAVGEGAVTATHKVFPVASTQGFQMIVEVPRLGQTYTYDIAEGTDIFDAAWAYDFDIQIDDEGMMVSVSGTPIDGWQPGGTITGGGEEIQ